jgi:hypothetical protein
MLRSVNKILEFTIHATDGDIGHCENFLFDDRAWTVRYIVVKTGTWLSGRKVVVSPVFLDEPDWQENHLPVRLTRQQIEKSPLLDEYAPVSRQYEINYHMHFALPFYWVGQDLWGAYPDPAGVVYPVPDLPEPDVGETETEPEEGHLRACREITGYHIAATDGDVGHIEDFLFDDTTWALRYLVVDTRNWLHRKKVLLSPQWIEWIHWVDEKVKVNLDINAIKNAPAYEPSQPVDRHYETRLFDYYQRPYYWNP